MNALLLLSLTLLLSPFSFAANRPFSNKEFRIGFPEEPAMLHRLLSSSANTTFVIQLTNQAALVTMDAQSKWVPMVAEKVPTLENKMARWYTRYGQGLSIVPCHPAEPEQRCWRY